MCARVLRLRSSHHYNRVRAARLLLAAGWLLVAGPMAWAQPGQEQERAIAALRKLGATVRVDEKAPGKPAVGVDLASCAVTEAGLAHLRSLTQLRKLDL